MKTLLFIRHGESESNSQQICTGQIDVALTKLGLAQAKTAGKQLKESGEKIDLIISSPLKRAHDTAREIARLIGYPQDKIVLNEDAMERCLGELEGQPTSVQHGFSDEQYVSKGAESEEELLRRAKSLIHFATARPEETILIVSHNQFGRSLLAYAQKRERAGIAKLPNAQVIKLL